MFNAEKFGSQKKESKEQFSGYIDIYGMRHSNRYAGSGEWTDPSTGEVVEFDDTQDLTPQGKEVARKFGATLKKEGDYLHVTSTASIEDRARETGEDVEVGAGEEPLFRDEKGGVITNRGIGMNYKELGDRAQGLLKGFKKLINNSAAETPNYGRLDPEDRAAARQKAQEVGFKEGMKDEDMVEECAEGVAYNLFALTEIARGSLKVDDKDKVAMPLVNHGLFNESFLKKVMVIEDESGNQQRGFDDVGEIGGFFKPAEAFKLRIKFSSDGHEEYELSFTDPERQALFVGKKISLDWDVVKDLFHKYDRRLAEFEGREPFFEEEY